MVVRKKAFVQPFGGSLKEMEGLKELVTKMEDKIEQLEKEKD